MSQESDEKKAEKHSNTNAMSGAWIALDVGVGAAVGVAQVSRFF
jgi:hypothetical protein